MKKRSYYENLWLEIKKKHQSIQRNRPTNLIKPHWKKVSCWHNFIHMIIWTVSADMLSSFFIHDSKHDTRCSLTVYLVCQWTTSFWFFVSSLWESDGPPWFFELWSRESDFTPWDIAGLTGLISAASRTGRMPISPFSSRCQSSCSTNFTLN